MQADKGSRDSRTGIENIEEELFPISGVMQCTVPIKLQEVQKAKWLRKRSNDLLRNIYK